MKVDVTASVPLSFSIELEEGQTIQEAVENYINSQIRCDVDGEIEINDFSAPIDIDTDQALCICSKCNKEFAELWSNEECDECEDKDEE